jgi:hypothetical protein
MREKTDEVKLCLRPYQSGVWAGPSTYNVDHPHGPRPSPHLSVAQVRQTPCNKLNKAIRDNKQKHIKFVADTLLKKQKAPSFNTGGS